MASKKATLKGFQWRRNMPKEKRTLQQKQYKIKLHLRSNFKIIN
jgi:hypothetical protein